MVKQTPPCWQIRCADPREGDVNAKIYQGNSGDCLWATEIIARGF